jgi:hypothetical protein
MGAHGLATLYGIYGVGEVFAIEGIKKHHVYRKPDGQ